MEANANSTKNVASLLDFDSFYLHSKSLKKHQNKKSFNIRLYSVIFSNISCLAKEKAESSGNNGDNNWQILSEEIAKLKSENNGSYDEFLSIWAKKNQNYDHVILYFKPNEKFIQSMKRLFPTGIFLTVTGTITEQKLHPLRYEYYVDSSRPENFEFNGDLKKGNTGELGKFSTYYFTNRDVTSLVKLSVSLEWSMIPSVRKEQSIDTPELPPVQRRQGSNVETTGIPILQLDPGNIVSKMFSCDSTKDLTIQVKNGCEVKCHKVIFAAHSTVLATMVSSTSSTKESNKTGKVEMLELSEDGINYLLKYFYGMPIPLNTLSSDMALELFQTANKYNLPEMENAIGKLFLEKESEWFTADVALGLHFFVKKLDGLGDLKELSLKILTRNPEEVKKCRRYQQLTQKEALDLLWILFEKK